MSRALYVHIPFCASICAYCDFCRVKYHNGLADRYLDALENELGRITDPHFHTVYIGGGTPSALSLKQLESLFRMLAPYLHDATEITIEVNPETLDEEKAALFERAGINRVSLGVQSFQQRLLDICERRHTKADVLNALTLLRKAGIHNISLDFIYGLPTQKKEEFLDDMAQAVECGVPHLSFYMLTIEEHSAFGRRGIKPQEEEESDEMYFEAIEYLKENGFHQYEISNFALKGYESEHNKIYWRYEDYEGVGLGASGKVGSIRYTNTGNFADYFEGKWRAEEVTLKQKDLYFETVMMGLRLKDGVVLDPDITSYYREVIGSLKEKGLLTETDGKLACSEQGYYILNDILFEFLED